MLNYNEKFCKTYGARKTEYDRSLAIHKVIRYLSGKYEFFGELGSGSFGDVIGFRSRADGKLYAAKIIDPSVTSEGELQLWPSFDHPNVLPVSKLIRRHYADIFLMPYHSKCLLDVIGDPHYRYSQNSFGVTVKWMKGVVSGLEYLHSVCNVCHLDLKANNILITTQRSAVICDFSSIQETSRPTNDYVLPKGYNPPEAWPVERNRTRPMVDGKAFDIWSLGMLMLNIITNRWIESHLWGRTSWWDEIYPHVFKGLQEPCFSCLVEKTFPRADVSSSDCSDVLNLLRSVLRYKAEDRPSVSRILQHRLFSETKSESLLEPDTIWMQDKRSSVSDDSVTTQERTSTSYASSEEGLRGMKSRVTYIINTLSDSLTEERVNPRENTPVLSGDFLCDDIAVDIQLTAGLTVLINKAVVIARKEERKIKRNQRDRSVGRRIWRWFRKRLGCIKCY